MYNKIIYKYIIKHIIISNSYKYQMNKTEFQKLSEHSISFKKTKCQVINMQIKIILNLCIIHI